MGAAACPGEQSCRPDAGLAGCSNATRRERYGARQRPGDGREVKGSKRGTVHLAGKGAKDQKARGAEGGTAEC